MFIVIDQWDCKVAEFENRDDALAYIAERESLYRNRPSYGPRFYIKEAV